MVFKKLSKVKNVVWDSFRSPKAIAALKLGAAIIGVVQAIDELRETSKAPPRKIGFRINSDD